MQYLCTQHPNLVDSQIVVNKEEGRGAALFCERGDTSGRFLDIRQNVVAITKFNNVCMHVAHKRKQDLKLCFRKGLCLPIGS